MTHAEYIDPAAAATRCTDAELAIVNMRNARMSWTDIAAVTHRTRGSVRTMWGSANRKVNGGYVPPTPAVPASELAPGYVQPTRAERNATERAVRATDPDVLATWQGVPVAGTRGAIAGTIPGQPARSKK